MRSSKSKVFRYYAEFKETKTVETPPRLRVFSDSSVRGLDEVSDLLVRVLTLVKD